MKVFIIKFPNTFSFLNGYIVVVVCWLFISSFLLSSCEKAGVMPRFSSLSIEIDHVVNEDVLQLDPIQFVNEAGNVYSVTDVKYYLSNITLTSLDGSTFYDTEIHYVDFEEIESLSIFLDSINPGKYATISFDLGIDSVRNLTGYLPNTLNNINMAWPDPMGGGYHFLKFEGKFEMSPDTFGFAFHIGKSMMKIHYTLELNKELKYWNESIHLKHDLNEWFKTPTTYDFTIHEPYSMSSDSVMQVLKFNGSDAFSL